MQCILNYKEKLVQAREGLRLEWGILEGTRNEVEFLHSCVKELMEKLKQFQADSAQEERDECAHASVEQLTANIDMGWK